jgi:hypothetical protein
MVWAQEKMVKELQYFPAEDLAKSEVLPESARESYSRVLAAFHEPSLWKLREDRGVECYRFLWLRTFHPAVCIRIEIHAKRGGVLFKKVGTGEYGFGGVGRLTLNKREQLTPEATGKFLAQLWFFKVCDEPPLDERTGLDGARWILEGIKGGVYCVVDRWCPEKGPVRTIGLKMLIDLAKLKLLYQEVY